MAKVTVAIEKRYIITVRERPQKQKLFLDFLFSLVKAGFCLKIESIKTI